MTLTLKNAVEKAAVGHKPSIRRCIKELTEATATETAMTAPRVANITARLSQQFGHRYGGNSWIEIGNAWKKDLETMLQRAE